MCRTVHRSPCASRLGADDAAAERVLRSAVSNPSSGAVMMTLFPDNLSLVGSPYHWAILGLVLVMIFAPRLLPPLARLLARYLGRELRRRLGLPLPPQRRAPERRPPMEVLPPETPQPTLRASDPTPLASPPSTAPLGSVWRKVVLVGGAIAALSWYLLHAR